MIKRENTNQTFKARPYFLLMPAPLSKTSLNCPLQKLEDIGPLFNLKPAFHRGEGSR